MESTTLELLPVCECGYILSDLKIGRIVDTDGWKSMRPFTPDYCCNCGRIIKELKLDAKFLETLMKEGLV